jgi:hypothetical protein
VATGLLALLGVGLSGRLLRPQPRIEAGLFGPVDLASAPPAVQPRPAPPPLTAPPAMPAPPPPQPVGPQPPVKLLAFA